MTGVADVMTGPDRLGARVDALDICEPGRLVVTRLRPGDYDPALSESGVISVVRSLNLDTDSALYRSVAELTSNLQILFHMADGGTDVSLYKMPSGTGL